MVAQERFIWKCSVTGWSWREGYDCGCGREIPATKEVAESEALAHQKSTGHKCAISELTNFALRKWKKDFNRQNKEKQKEILCILETIGEDNRRKVYQVLREEFEENLD